MRNTMAEKQGRDLKRSILFIPRCQQSRTLEGLRECDGVFPKYALRAALRELAAKGEVVAAVGMAGRLTCYLRRAAVQP